MCAHVCVFLKVYSAFLLKIEFEVAWSNLKNDKLMLK